MNMWGCLAVIPARHWRDLSYPLELFVRVTDLSHKVGVDTRQEGYSADQ
jgi:hypothetical protein